MRPMHQTGNSIQCSGDKVKDKALVVLSGGQDSVTSLFWTMKEFKEVETMTFFYGQRHSTEIQAARMISEKLGVKWKLVNLLGYGNLVKSALTDEQMEVKNRDGLRGLPNTFTPGRNVVFLSVAASYAIDNGIHSLVTGVCQTDYSGYPDCRRTTIDALETTLRFGTDTPDFEILTPLMYLTKKETVILAKFMPGCFDALAHTVTCYHGKKPGCGQCPSCIIRLRGFQEAGLGDPAAL